MRNGIEVRPNGATIEKVTRHDGPYRCYRIKEDPKRELWDYLNNARQYADNMAVDPVTGVKSFAWRHHREGLAARRFLPWLQNQWEWRGVTPDTPFGASLFHEVESPLSTYTSEFEARYQFAFHSNLGSITVLNRRTGFGHRDVETGYRDPDGLFWLASGGCDVRSAGCETVGAAIEWVKKNANTCVGLKP